MRTIQNLKARKLGIVARADAAHDAACAGVSKIHRPGNGVVDTLKARPVSDERLAEVIKMVPPRIHPALEDNPRLQGVGAQVPDAAALEALNSMRRLKVAADVNGLVEIKPPIVPPAQRMQRVVGVLGAKPGKDDLLFVRAPVAIGIAEMQELSTLRHIRPSIARLNARGNEQAIGKDRCLVGLAIPSGVLQHDNFIIGHLPGLDLRINRGRGHPQPTFRIKVHLDGLGQLRIFCKERDLNARHGVELWNRLRLEWCLGNGHRWLGCRL